MPERPEIGVVILAGGEATRLPGKLEMSAGGIPMLARVYRNVSPGRRTFVSCKGALSAELDLLIECPKVVDRWPRRGPLGGLLSTLDDVPTPLFVAVAGDLPFFDAAFIERLASAWQPGDEAVVPVHRARGPEQLEPLAALYDRAAFMREGTAVLEERGALHELLRRLRVRRYPVEGKDTRIFTNINTPQDYAAVVAWMG